VTGAGVVIQMEDGSFKAVPPDAAREHLAAMSKEQRALYESVSE
jgi:hypothetical protein